MKKLLIALMVLALAAAAAFGAWYFTQPRGLGPGDIGEAVGNAQIRLSELGYYRGTCSAVYDAGLEHAVRCFQNANGLEVTGTLRKGDLDALYAKSAARSRFCLTFLDVGQADSMLIECDGYAALVDGGNRGDSQKLYAVLKQKNIETLSAVFCTHPHEDHAGGLSGALHYAKTEAAYCSAETGEGDFFRDFLDLLRAQNVALTVPEVGTEINVGSAVVTVLGPTGAGEDENNTSLVLRVNYGDRRFLLMGDAEQPEEDALLETGAALSADVIKVGHHGSRRACSEAFLRQVGAKTAVVSVGEQNRYGHPNGDTLARLVSAGCTLYRTDLSGDIAMESDGKTLTVATQRDADPAQAAEGAVLQPDVTEAPTPLPAAIPEGTAYVLNEASHKVHLPTCDSVNEIDASQRRYSTELLEALLKCGYIPCGSCRAGQAEPEAPTASPEGTTYVLNEGSRKMHLPTCASVHQMDASRRVYSTESSEALLERGYTPCGSCKAGLDALEATTAAPKKTDEGSAGRIEIPEGTTYVLNEKNRKIHAPDCGSVKQMSAENRFFTRKSLDTLLAEGYTVCGSCKAQ